jgi:hypothetical protein
MKMGLLHGGIVCALILALVVGVFAAAIAAEPNPAGAPPIARVAHTDGRYHLMVDGQPYLILGGQAHNSSASNAADIERVCNSVAGIHGNTLIIPTYWELVEPQPGAFDFRLIDEVIAAARRHGLRLVLQWFATWKNGEMNYTPEWVKLNRAKFRRVIGLRGEELNIITPLCAAALDADARAFRAVMRHIRSVDEGHRTVVVMQVENEPGLLGSDRDHSRYATRLFNGPVPAELMAYLRKHRDGLTASMRAALSQSKFRSSGTWAEVFGRMAPEAFSAWHIARYLDAVAAAGKKEYPLPMYANAWLIEPHGERPGRWPSGGPTEHVLDIWKAAAPHLDFIAPDIYYPKFYDSAVIYTRPDNPLFVPEVNYMPFFGALAFMTFATFNGMCFSPFGIDGAVEDGKVTEGAAQFEDSYRVLRPLLPMIARYQYTGKLHAVIQGISPGEDWAHNIALSDGTVAAMVEFTIMLDPEKRRGRGMILELGPGDYIIVGASFKVDFRALKGPLRDIGLASVEEGTFEGERWVPQRQLTGADMRVRLPDKAAILRVKLAGL